jgi:Ca2+-binding RTX toxin-like protein
MARLTLNAGESVGLSSGNYTIYGTVSGAETVTVAAGTTVSFDASFNRGGDVFTLTGNAGSYTAVRSGSALLLTDTSGATVTIPVGTTASSVKFADAAARSLVYDTTAGAINLGSQTITASTVSVTAGTGGSAADAAKTMVLTTGLNSGSAFTGGSGNDTFDGSTANSLNTGDVLAGGDGTDTLSATLNGTSAAPNVSGVEIVNLTVTSASTVSAANISGVTTINTVGSTADLTVTNLATVPTTLGVNSNSNTTTLNFTSAALAGAADKLSVNLDSVSGNSTVSLGLVSGATGTLETVHLTSGSVANTLKTIDSSAVSTATLEISGDQDLTITDALNGLIRTVSAGSAAGKLTFSTGANDTSVTTGSGADNITGGAGNDVISLGAGNDTVTSGAGKDNIDGGAGNDRIQFDGANLDANDTISGGADTDTLVLTANSTIVDTAFAHVSGVENLTATANNAIVATFNANADAAGIASVTGAGAGNDNITVQSGFDNALTVALGTGDDTVSASGSNASLTVTAVASAIDANDVLTGGALSGDVIKLTANGGTATFGGSVTKFETVQVVAGSVADNDIVIALHDNMIAGANSISVDASGLANSNATLTLTSGESNTNATVNVTGGNGADTITGASEKSNFSGGAGNDVFKFASSVLDANDTVTGGDGTDTIQLTDNNGGYTDVMFTNVSGVEKVSVVAGTANWSATFNGNADTAGFSTVTGATTSNENISLGSAFDNALRIDLGGGDDTVRGASSNAALTVSTNAANFTTADSLVGGAGSGDVIRVTMGAGAETAAFGNVSGFETITVVGSGDNDVTITMNDTMIAANGSLTVDATDLSNSNATLTLTSAETTTTATLTVNGGAGADTITGGAEKSNFSGNDGNDVFVFDADNLTSSDSLSGGAGSDTLQISAHHANGVQDSDFSHISGVETLTVSASGNAVVATLGANADASADFTTITGVGAANDVITVGAGFDNALRVNLATGDDKVDASASAATITASAVAAAFDANDTLIGGTGASDTIRIVADNNGTGAVFGSSVSGFEKIVVVGDNDLDVKVTTSDAMTNRAVTLSVDATDLSNSNATLTFVSGEATDELVTINVTGGNGADSMTGGLEQSNFTGGAGNDTFTFSSANLNAYDSVDGGTGTDTLSVSGTIADSAFSHVTNIDALSAYSGNVAVTLGASADASGLATVTGGSGNDIVTIGAGFDNAIRVAIGAGNDKVNATGSAAVVTIASASAIDASDTLIGGTTAGDVISISGNTSATFGGNVSGFETLTVTYNAGGADVSSITVHDNMTAAGSTLTVSAAAENASTDAFNFSGGAELDGYLNITGSAGADSISGGLQADTISGGNGADIILGGGGADSLTGGEGADAITGGAGADTIILTETTAAADHVKFTSNLFTEAGDTITGFNANHSSDVIDFNSTVVTNGGNTVATLNTTDVNGTVGANDVFIEITTQLSNLTSASDVASSLSGVNVSTVANGETVIFAVHDATDMYLWAFTQDGRGGIQSSDLTMVAKLVGVTDIANGDLALGA